MPSEIYRRPATLLGEPYLLTPGPLTTSAQVKKAMLKDWGSWDDDFRAMTRDLRTRLLALANAIADAYDCVPIQGSGTFTIEAMLGSFVPADGKVLVLANGAYGLRAAQIIEYCKRDYSLINKGDFLPPRGDEVARALADDPAISHVFVVHCETSSGILNPIEEIAEVTHTFGRKLLIDAMSSFGAIALSADSIQYAALASSPNKCIEAVPGFGFIIASTEEFEAAAGNSPSLSLDIEAQWRTMNTTGQWRFTPPTHIVAACIEALKAHETEGGVVARGTRYSRNRDTLVEGMRGLGFETLLHDRWLSPIIVTFFCPDDSAFSFDRFYQLMKEHGFIIYPGKLTVADSFRIGCIGHFDDYVMQQVVDAADSALSTMGVISAQPPEIVYQDRYKTITS